MKKLVLLAPLAILALPIAASPVSAETVTIKTRSDNGLHRGWHHGRGHAYGARKVVVKRVYRDRDVRATGSTRITKKVTRTNEFGDRVTKKVTRTVD